LQYQLLVESEKETINLYNVKILRSDVIDLNFERERESAILLLADFDASETRRHTRIPAKRRQRRRYTCDELMAQEPNFNYHFLFSGDWHSLREGDIRFNIDLLNSFKTAPSLVRNTDIAGLYEYW
jgi:hypothetical protein